MAIEISAKFPIHGFFSRRRGEKEGGWSGGRGRQLRRERRRVEAMDGEREGDGSEDDPAETIRKELGLLQAEMEDTQRKANNARVRFIRLTNAVEQLALGAAASMRAGDEEGARRQLEEKARVMEALAASQKRAEGLEALGTKLLEIISRKETLLISALATTNTMDSSNRSSYDVREIPPAIEAREERGKFETDTETERERSLKSASDDQLRERFLNMERADLERLLQRSPEILSRESSTESSTEYFTDSSTESSTEMGTESEVLEDNSLVALEREIAETEAKYGRILKMGSEGEISVDEFQLKKSTAKELLVQLYRIRDRMITSKAAEDKGKDELGGGEERVVEEREGGGDGEEISSQQSPMLQMKPNVLSAIDLLRQGNKAAAASYLQRWLTSPLSQQSFPPSWADLASDFEGASLSPVEGGELYAAYLKHYGVVGALTAVTPNSWDQRETDETTKENVGKLEAFLNIEREVAYRIRYQLARSTVVDSALSSTIDEESLLPSLGSILSLNEDDTENIQMESEAASKLKRYIAILFKEMQFSGSASGGWRDAEWTLTRKNQKDIEWALRSIRIEGSTALAAAAAAGRDICYVIIEQAVKSLQQSGNPTKECRFHLENLIRFIHGAALPTMFLVSGNGNGTENDNIEMERSSFSEGNKQEDLQNFVKLLRVKVSPIGGDSESLFLAFCESSFSEMAEKAARVALSGGSTDEILESSPSLLHTSTLSSVLSLSPPVASFIRERALKKVFSEKTKQAMEDSWMTQKEWKALGAQQRILQLSDEEASKIREEISAARVGGLCRKLLDKRNRGGDVTSGDIRDLTMICSNLGATQVSGVDIRDRMLLFRKALQASLDTQNFNQTVSPPSLILEGRQILAVLERAFSLQKDETVAAISSVCETAAASALLQARASFQRGQRETAASDMGRLGVALGTHPWTPEYVEGLSPRVGSEEEARGLFSMYKNLFGSSMDIEPNVQQQDIKIEVLNRIQTYLGIGE